MSRPQKLVFKPYFPECTTFVHIPNINKFIPTSYGLRDLNKRDIYDFEAQYFIFVILFFTNYLQPISCIHQWCKETFHNAYTEDLSKTFRCNHFLLIHPNYLRESTFPHYEKYIKNTYFFQDFKKYRGNRSIIYPLKITQEIWALVLLRVNDNQNYFSVYRIEVRSLSHTITSINAAEEKYQRKIAMLSKIFFGDTKTPGLELGIKLKLNYNVPGVFIIYCLVEIIRHPLAPITEIPSRFCNPNIIQKLREIAIEKNADCVNLVGLTKKSCDNLTDTRSRAPKATEVIDLTKSTQESEPTINDEIEVVLPPNPTSNSAVQRISLKRKIPINPDPIQIFSNQNNQQEVLPHSISSKSKKILSETDCQFLPDGCVFRNVLEKLCKRDYVPYFSGERNSFCQFYLDFSLSHALNDILNIQHTSHRDIFFPFCYNAETIPNFYIYYHNYSSTIKHHFLITPFASPNTIQVKINEFKKRAIEFTGRASKIAIQKNPDLSRLFSEYQQDFEKGTYDSAIESFLIELGGMDYNYSDYNKTRRVFKMNNRKNLSCDTFLMTPQLLYDFLNGVLEQMEFYPISHNDLKFRGGLYNFAISVISRHTILSENESILFSTMIRKDFKKYVTESWDP